MARVWILKICSLACVLGTPISISRSKRPGRRRADPKLQDVGRTDDDDLAPSHETIHQTEKLCHHALFDLADHLGAFRSDGIDLVDEEDRRGVARCLFEDLAEFGLAFAVELPHDFGAVRSMECTRLSAATARARRVSPVPGGPSRARPSARESQPLEDARVLQRQLNHFAHARHFTLGSPPISS